MLFDGFSLHLNPWNSKGRHLRFHLSFVRKSSLKQLNCAVLSGLSSDFTAGSILNFFTRWVKKFWSFLTGNSELSECNKRLSNGYKLNFRTKQCEISIRFPNEFHGSRSRPVHRRWTSPLVSMIPHIWGNLIPLSAFVPNTVYCATENYNHNIYAWRGWRFSWGKIFPQLHFLPMIRKSASWTPCGGQSNFGPIYWAQFCAEQEPAQFWADYIFRENPYTQKPQKLLRDYKQMYNCCENRYKLWFYAVFAKK